MDVITAVLKASELTFCTFLQSASIVMRYRWSAVGGKMVEELGEGGLELDVVDTNMKGCEVVADMEIGKINDEVLR